MTAARQFPSRSSDQVWRAREKKSCTLLTTPMYQFLPCSLKCNSDELGQSLHHAATCASGTAFRGVRWESNVHQYQYVRDSQDLTRPSCTLACWRCSIPPLTLMAAVVVCASLYFERIVSSRLLSAVCVVHAGATVPIILFIAAFGVHAVMQVERRVFCGL